MEDRELNCSLCLCVCACVRVRMCLRISCHRGTLKIVSQGVTGCETNWVKPSHFLVENVNITVLKRVSVILEM